MLIALEPPVWARGLYKNELTRSQISAGNRIQAFRPPFASIPREDYHGLASRMGYALDSFLKTIETPEREWNLFEVSLQLSHLVGRVDLQTYRTRIREWERQLRAMISPSDDDYGVIDRLNELLYQQEGFSGNKEDFYNPANSFMTSVIDQKRGIPITLSILYRELAARQGLQLAYVSMPGHFLLKLTTPNRDVFVDAFNAGQMILRDECEERMRELYGDDAEFRDEYLQAAGPRVVLLRLLLNLKHIYRSQGNLALLVRVLDRRIPLMQDPTPEVLERGLAKLGLDDYRGAFQDLETFVAQSKDESMKALVQSQLERLRRLAVGN